MGHDEEIFYVSQAWEQRNLLYEEGLALYEKSTKRCDRANEAADEAEQFFLDGNDNYNTALTRTGWRRDKQFYIGIRRHKRSREKRAKSALHLFYAQQFHNEAEQKFADGDLILSTTEITFT
jgi:hypothetical protein